jgi:DNA-binding CsgD family transcriptional regulator
MVQVQSPVRLSAAQRRLLIAVCRPVARARSAPTDRELARELFVAETVVERQMRSLMGLFGADDRAELAEQALARGAVTRPELFGP